MFGFNYEKPAMLFICFAISEAQLTTAEKPGIPDVGWDVAGAVCLIGSLQDRAGLLRKMIVVSSVDPKAQVVAETLRHPYPKLGSC
jgi:hypothetical protein